MVRQRRPHFVEEVDEVIFFYERIQDSSLAKLEINSQPQTWENPRLSSWLRLLRQIESTTLALFRLLWLLMKNPVYPIGHRPLAANPNPSIQSKIVLAMSFHKGCERFHIKHMICVSS